MGGQLLNGWMDGCMLNAQLDVWVEKLAIRAIRDEQIDVHIKRGKKQKR